jgi:hypothetical protein
MKDGLMSIGYREFEGLDGKWVDDIALISRIVQQYQESQQHLRQHGATFGESKGITIRG